MPSSRARGVPRAALPCRFPAGVAALVAAAIVSVTAVPVTGPAGARTAVPARRVPAPAAANDPAARIAALGGLVDTRSRAAAAAIARRNTAASQLARARFAENLALARADQLSRIADAAVARYERSREQAGAVASGLYQNAGQPQVLVRLLESESASQYGYRQEIAQQVADIQTDIVRRTLAMRRAALKASRAADEQKAQFHAQVISLQATVPKLAREVDGAQASLARAKFWLTRWQSIAGGVNTPIMSHSILSPTEIATWFQATRHHPHITVSVAQLTQAYVDEGEALRVRGDIAFAQSILETGGFSFPAGGQLLGTDNNFAGIDACDSCAHGRGFPDARSGVRAQLQLLRIYADANASSAQFPGGPLMPNLDHHFLKGRVPTWNGLTHTWATADAYGDRILGIYEQMLGWLTDRAQL